MKIKFTYYINRAAENNNQRYLLFANFNENRGLRSFINKLYKLPSPRYLAINKKQILNYFAYDNRARSITIEEYLNAKDEFYIRGWQLNEPSSLLFENTNTYEEFEINTPDDILKVYERLKEINSVLRL